MPNLPKRQKRRAYIPKRKRIPTSDQSFYNSTAWRKTRERYKKTNGPVCEACLFADIVTPESANCDTDHIISISAGGDKYDPRNLNRLCKKHHNRKSGLENRGKPLVDSMENERGYLIPAEPKQVLWAMLIN